MVRLASPKGTGSAIRDITARPSSSSAPLSRPPIRSAPQAPTRMPPSDTVQGAGRCPNRLERALCRPRGWRRLGPQHVNSGGLSADHASDITPEFAVNGGVLGGTIGYNAQFGGLWLFG